MTKYEFLSKLKNALENDLSNHSVQDHVNYYNDYITSEVAAGRIESEVLDELGDPWAIAKNIIASENTDAGNYEEYSYNSTDHNSRNNTSANPNIHIFGLDSWWKKLLLILGIIGVVMIVFSIITGLISLIAPFIIPIIIISFLLKLFKKR